MQVQVARSKHLPLRRGCRSGGSGTFRDLDKWLRLLLDTLLIAYLGTLLGVT
jgi:ABC-type phosphate/phosphonate transport system permease subunit